MKLAEGNSGSMEKSNLVCMRLHLERPCQGSESSETGASMWRSFDINAACRQENNVRNVQMNYENELLSMNFAGLCINVNGI